MAAFFVLIGFVVFGGAIIAAATMGAWVLRPLDRAAKNRRHPTQFTIADFFCLFLLIQLPMALVHALVPKSEPAAIWVLDGLGWFFFGAAWWAGVLRLSRAGIRHTWHRALFLVFVLPATLFGTAGGAVVALVLAVRTIVDFRQMDAFAMGMLSLLEIAIIVGLYVCRRATRWMVAAASPPAAEVTAPVAEMDDDP